MPRPTVRLGSSKRQPSAKTLARVAALQASWDKSPDAATRDALTGAQRDAMGRALDWFNERDAMIRARPGPAHRTARPWNLARPRLDKPPAAEILLSRDVGPHDPYTTRDRVRW